VRQTEEAIATADVVVQVVDGTVTVLDDDERVARALRRCGAATLLVVNKVDHEVDVPRQVSTSGWASGIRSRSPRATAAGSRTCWTRSSRCSPTSRARTVRSSPPGTPRIAIVGRPNVGKSSLFNRLIGDERSIVHDAPHTTRDAIDTLVQLDGQDLVFVDTAGMRRRYRSGEDLEQYAVDRTRAAIERSDVVLFLIDAGEPIGAQEQRLAAMLREAGCGLVIVLNKWDTVDEERREDLERELDRLLGFAAWAPRVNVSALTGTRGQPARARRSRRSSPTTVDASRPASSTRSSPAPSRTTRRRAAGRARSACATPSRSTSRRRASCCSRAARSRTPTCATSNGCSASATTSRGAARHRDARTRKDAAEVRPTAASARAARRRAVRARPAGAAGARGA
jgi:small GTP-binding protein